MAGPYYVRSTDGLDASDGLSWVNAKATLAGAFAVAAAGETIWVSQVHAESSAGALNLNSAGTAGAPIIIACGNDAAEPPTVLATTAIVTTTGNGIMKFTGSFYCYGIKFACGSGSGSGAGINLAGNPASPVAAGQAFDTCVFKIVNTQAGAHITFFGTDKSACLVRWINCNAEFAAVGQGFQVDRGIFEWFAGAVVGATLPTILFDEGDQLGSVRLVGVDLSALASGKSLVSLAGLAQVSSFKFEHCKLGASVSLTSGVNPGPGPFVWLDNCDSSDTQYRMQRHDYRGDVYSETTIVRTGGASDGTTSLSHKIVSSANAEFTFPLYGPELFAYNSSIGSSKTITVEIVHDNVTALTNAEVWLEVESLETNAFPLSKIKDDRAVDILAIPVNQDSSSVTWTTTGLSNPNKQKLMVAVAPREVGIIRCRVALAKASYTIYVDPLITITDALGLNDLISVVESVTITKT